MDLKKQHYRRNLFLLLQGQFVTNLGNHIFDVAMLLWIRELTGSAAIMGLAMLFSGLPEALLAPIGGAMADRYGRVRVMVAADITGGLVFLGVLLVCFADPGPMGIVAALVAANLALGLCSACFIPSVTSLVPMLAPTTSLEKANAAQQFSDTGGRMIGQALGGFVFALLGGIWAVGLNAASFILSALSESFIKGDKAPANPSEGTIENPVRSAWESLKRVWKRRGLRRLVLGIAAFHFCLSALPVLLPFLAEHRLGLGGKWLGFLYVSYTGGIMAGFVLAGIVSGYCGDRMKTIAVAASLAGLFFCLAGLSKTAWLTVPALLCIGMSIGLIVVNLMTALQLAADDTERGRIMGAAQAVGGSSLPVGMAIFGLLLDLAERAGFSTHSAIAFLLAASGAASVVVGILMYLGSMASEAQ